MSEKTLDHYRAFIQMPVIVHEKQTHVVETAVYFPYHYQPVSGQWLFHPAVKGLMPIAAVFYDGYREAVVLTTGGAAYDYTVTIEEWLQDRPDWALADPALITLEKREDDSSKGNL